MSKTLLLADDSMTIQKVVELTFMDQDYEVVAVSDGSSALEKLGEVNPDLVIADVHMPGADGYEVCRQTKATSAGTPVLLLVGTFEEFDEEKAASAGADGHLKKPFDSQELLKKVVALVSGGGAAAAPAPPAPESDESPELTTQPAAPRPEAPAPSPQAPRPAAPTPPPAPEPAVPEPATARPAAPQSPVAPEPATPEPVVPEEPAAEPTPTAGSADLQPSTAETRPTQARGPDGSPAAGEGSEGAESAEEPASPEEAAAAPAPEPAAEEPAEPETAAEAASPNGRLSDEDVERIARKVIELSGGDALKEVAWEVIPDLAEVVIRERIAELESDVD